MLGVMLNLKLVGRIQSKINHYAIFNVLYSVSNMLYGIV